MGQRHSVASIPDINLYARKPAVALFAVIAAILTIASTAHAQTLTVLHTFTGEPDGRYPVAGLAMDAAGNVYGTTDFGGTNDQGLVFKVAHKASGWVFTPLYSFQGGADGSNPIGGVTVGPDGNLYGAVSEGGEHGKGAVYKLTPPASFNCRTLFCPWTKTPLYQFTGGADGAYPEGTPIFDRSGNLYGTAVSGGAANAGVVFKLTPSRNGWIDSVLYSFAGSPDGAAPFSTLTFDNNGNLYGTTTGGGPANVGTVYELTPSGSHWTEQVLYAFNGTNDGAIPYAGVVLDPEGNLYGDTFYDGTYSGGAIFELMPSNGNWTFSVLYSPELSGLGGPAGTLARTSNGTLYGTLFSGGNDACSGYGCGNVFQLSPSNGGWTYTSLYVFTGGADGGNPQGQLILDSAGNVYGTTSGSLGGDGSVFELTP
jgi:uncharacterized repeat protein (TIGR03803 family)